MIRYSQIRSVRHRTHLLTQAFVLAAAVCNTRPSRQMSNPDHVHSKPPPSPSHESSSESETPLREGEAEYRKPWVPTEEEWAGIKKKEEEAIKQRREKEEEEKKFDEETRDWLALLDS